MKLFLILSFLVTLTREVLAQSAYTPPKEALITVQGIPWASATPTGKRFRARFTECEVSNTCDGVKLKYGCKTDPNHNTALLRFPDGTVFFDAKMGLDADGSFYAHHTPGSTDQPETSFRYDVHGKPSVDAGNVPFIVIPLGGFDKEMGIQLGDIAAVVYKNNVSYALVADFGPKCKIGEGSIRLHEELGHQVCRQRDVEGNCTKLRNVGLAKDVLYFIFPHSKLPGLTPENATRRISDAGRELFDALRNTGH